MSDTNRDSSDDRPVKVTDRRMFTPDGQLREEYRHIEENAGSPAAGSPAASERRPPEPRPPQRQPPPEPRPPEPEPDQPGFLDLVSLLAENASIYLRQASIPGVDEPLQNLELAKLHIDLLGVLKDKTAGNLNSQEQAVLDDVLYRLRLAYSGQRGF